MKAMKTYCRECLKKNPEHRDVCRACKEPISDQLKEEEVRPIVQQLHKKGNLYRERVSSGMSFVVIGLTLLIIGIIFYYLSFKLDQDNTEEAVFILTTSCAEFYVFVIGVGVGGILFLFGAVWAILWSYRRREIYHDVDEIRKNLSLTVSSTPLIFVVWWRKLSQFIFRATYRRSRKKAR